jgi:hypothetical protein
MSEANTHSRGGKNESTARRYHARALRARQARPCETAQSVGDVQHASDDMTKAKRAWRKANAYVRSGQHDKAIYWLSRTQAILDGIDPTAGASKGSNELHALSICLQADPDWCQ